MVLHNEEENFLFGWKQTLKYNKQIKFDEAKHYIYKAGLFAQCFPVEQPESICDNSNVIDLSQYKDTVEMTSEFRANFENTGIMINGTVLTEKTKPIQENPITLGEIRETRTGLDSYILTGDKKQKFTYLRGAKKLLVQSQMESHIFIQKVPCPFFITFKCLYLLKRESLCLQS